ncbi:MAG: TolC family protein [Gammaproteobacteria bacterium]|nr:TolC family protein [Gammaproteobacteria bacterium]
MLRKSAGRLAAVLLMLVLSPFLYAQERVGVGVVLDGRPDRTAERQQLYIDELLNLTEGEFTVEIIEFAGAWSGESIGLAADRAYADPRVDLVLVAGFVANQLVATRGEYPKPTFLPLVLDVNLLGKPARNGKSGIRNLSYLTAYANFASDLDALARLVPYQQLVIFLDQELSRAIPPLRDAAFSVSESRGIELIEVGHDGEDHRLMNRVPAGADAIIIAGLPRMPEPRFIELIDAINAAGLPSYSFVGVSDVEKGLLATNSEPRDLERQARLNALNMQAVLLGERAEDQPVSSNIRKQFTINMATARQIGVPISFDVRGEAILLHEDPVATGEAFGLVGIARQAREKNQDLVAQGYSVEAGAEDIALARASLLPQVGASAGYTTRRVTQSVAAGFLPESTTDAGLSVDQVIYADSVSANLAIQKQFQRSRAYALEELELDVVQAATTSYYGVLNARSQLGVQETNLSVSRRNLDLAKDRVRVGSSTPADVYRWEAEVARAQILVLDARATLNRNWNTLNRLLHRPLNSRIALAEASFDEPFVIERSEFEALLVSPADYDRFSQFFVDRGLGQAPELSQLEAQIVAKRREATSQRRAFWLPDFSLGGSYSRNIGQSGAGAGLLAGEEQDDWSIGLQATIPLFSSGLRRANLSKANLELLQLEAQYNATAERVEETIRIQMHLAQAAYGQIELSAAAAEATRKNYELVADAYARGTLSIIELLDAQDANVTAAAASVDSLYNFLITIMAVQRAVGGFDFLLPMDQRVELANAMREYLRTGTR